MRAAVAAVDAGVCVRRRLPDVVPEVLEDGRWHVIAAGKAAGAMLAAALDVVPRPPHAALCVSNQPATGLPDYVEVAVGGHPVPSASSVAAGHRALEIATATADADVLLVLLSGGASALLAAPAGGISLADKQAVTQRLLRAGADIYALNAVRKHLSMTKGGRLAAAAPARTLCLAVSDVVGDDPSVIGSGPTVGDPSTFGDALDVLDRFGGRQAYPGPVVAWLEAGARTGAHESPKPGARELARARLHVISGAAEARQGARAEAQRLGYRVLLHEDPIVGEARVVSVAHLQRAVAAAKPGAAPLCVVSAGETTVTVTGQGRGGRNQEFALAAVEPLAGFGRPIVVASVGTDGIDGPTDAAGALADPTSLGRAAAAGLPRPDAVLAENDSYRFFAGIGDLVMTGPTGTNVGDIQVILIA